MPPIADPAERNLQLQLTKERQREHVAGILQGEQDAGTYGTIEVHIQGGHLIRTVVKRSEKIP